MHRGQQSYDSNTHHDCGVVVRVEGDRPPAELEVSEAADEAGRGSDATFQFFRFSVFSLLDAAQVRQFPHVERPQRPAGLSRDPLPAVHPQEAVAVVPGERSWGYRVPI